MSLRAGTSSASQVDREEQGERNGQRAGACAAAHQPRRHRQPVHAQRGGGDERGGETAGARVPRRCTDRADRL